MLLRQPPSQFLNHQIQARSPTTGSIAEPSHTSEGVGLPLLSPPQCPPLCWHQTAPWGKNRVPFMCSQCLALTLHARGVSNIKGC